MFGELRTVPYLLMKGFKNIRYNGKKGLDFTAEFDGQFFYIETKHVRGPDFKTQEYAFTDRPKDLSSVYRIQPEKLIGLLEDDYSDKEKQVLKHGGTAENSVIFMITDLEETNAPWLDHIKIEDEHPILHFVLTRKIPTVVFGSGSVYEPKEGIFGKLQEFSWENFAKDFSST
jgi:hypothetical protein